MLMLAARAGPGPTPAGHANRAYEVFGRHKGCLSLFHRIESGGSAWESNPASPRWRGATDFEDREGHRAPFASGSSSVTDDAVAETGLSRRMCRLVSGWHEAVESLRPVAGRKNRATKPVSRPQQMGT